MTETVVFPVAPIVEELPGGEFDRPDPEGVVRLFGLYVSAECRAMSQIVGLKREDFHADGLKGLSNRELQAMRETVAQFWQTDQAQELEKDFIQEGRVGESVVDEKDQAARLEIAEIARTGASCTLDQEHADRLREYVKKCRVEIQDPHTTREKAGKLEELQKALRIELSATKSGLIAFNNRVRDFFESDYAGHNELGRTQLNNILAIAFQGNRELAGGEGRGVENEVALNLAIGSLVSELNQQDGRQRKLRSGTAEEDARSGDLVYTVDGKTIFIDAKTKKPEKLDSDKGYYIEPAYRKEAQGYDYYIIVWPPEGEVLGEHFEVSPEYMARISGMIEEADSLSVRTGVRRAAGLSSRSLPQGRRASPTR